VRCGDQGGETWHNGPAISTTKVILTVLSYWAVKLAAGIEVLLTVTVTRCDFKYSILVLT
jgi:hypothetical protein